MSKPKEKVKAPNVLKSAQLIYNVDIENREIIGTVTYQFNDSVQSPLFFNARHMSIQAISIGSQAIDPNEVEIFTTPSLNEVPNTTFQEVSASAFSEHIFNNTVGNFVIRSKIEPATPLTIQFSIHKDNPAITWNNEYMYTSPCSFGEGYLAPRLPFHEFLNEVTIFIDKSPAYTSLACGSRASSSPETDVFISSSPICLDSVFFAVGKFNTYSIPVAPDGRRAAQMSDIPNFMSYPASINDDVAVAAQEQQIEIVTGFVPAKLANAAALQYTLSEVPKMLEFFKIDIRIPYPQISFLFVPLANASTFALKTHTAPGIVLSPIENLITPREPYLVYNSRLFLASGLAMQISHALFQAERRYSTLADGLAGLFTFKYVQRVFGRNEAILLYMGLSEFVYQTDNITQEPLSLTTYASKRDSKPKETGSSNILLRLASTEYGYPLGEDYCSAIFRYSKSALFNIHIFLRSPTSITQKMNTYITESLFLPFDPDTYHKAITNETLSLKYIAGLFKLWFNTNGLPRLRVGYYANSNANNATNKKVTIALLPMYKPVMNTWENISVSVQENDDSQPKVESLDISDLKENTPSCEISRTARTGKAYNEPLFFLSNARSEIAVHNSSIMYVLVDPEVRYPPAMTFLDQRAACSALQLDRCVSDALQQIRAIRGLAFKVCAASHENLGATLGRNFNYRVCAEAATALAVLSPYSEEKTYNWLETWLKERFYRDNKFAFDGADLRKLHLFNSLVSAVSACRSNTSFTPHEAIETIRKLVMMDFEDFCTNPAYIIAGIISSCSHLRVPGAPFSNAAINHGAITKISDKIMKRLKDDKLSGSIHSVICFAAVEAIASLSDHGLIEYQFSELANIIMTDSHVVKLRRRVLELLTRNVFLCSTMDSSRNPLLDVSKESEVMREASYRLYKDVQKSAAALGYETVLDEDTHPALAVRTLWINTLIFIAKTKPDLTATAFQCIEIMLQSNVVVHSKPLTQSLLKFLWLPKPLHAHRLNGLALSDLDAALLIRDWPQIFVEPRGTIPEVFVSDDVMHEPRGTCAICLLGGSCSCSLLANSTDKYPTGIGYQKVFLENIPHLLTSTLWRNIVNILSINTDPSSLKSGISCLSALSSSRGYSVAKMLQIESKLETIFDNEDGFSAHTEAQYAGALQAALNDVNMSISKVLNVEPKIYGDDYTVLHEPKAKDTLPLHSDITIVDRDEDPTHRSLDVLFGISPAESVKVTFEIPK